MDLAAGSGLAELPQMYGIDHKSNSSPVHRTSWRLGGDGTFVRFADPCSKLPLLLHHAAASLTLVWAHTLVGAPDSETSPIGPQPAAERLFDGRTVLLQACTLDDIRLTISWGFGEAVALERRLMCLRASMVARHPRPANLHTGGAGQGIDLHARRLSEDLQASLSNNAEPDKHEAEVPAVLGMAMSEESLGSTAWAEEQLHAAKNPRGQHAHTTQSDGSAAAAATAAVRFTQPCGKYIEMYTTGMTVFGNVSSACSPPLPVIPQTKQVPAHAYAPVKQECNYERLQMDTAANTLRMVHALRQEARSGPPAWRAVMGDGAMLSCYADGHIHALWPDGMLLERVPEPAPFDFYCALLQQRAEAACAGNWPVWAGMSPEGSICLFDDNANMLSAQEPLAPKHGAGLDDVRSTQGTNHLSEVSSPINAAAALSGSCPANAMAAEKGSGVPLDGWGVAPVVCFIDPDTGVKVSVRLDLTLVLEFPGGHRLVEDLDGARLTETDGGWVAKVNARCSGFPYQYEDLMARVHAGMIILRVLGEARKLLGIMHASGASSGVHIITLHDLAIQSACLHMGPTSKLQLTP